MIEPPEREDGSVRIALDVRYRTGSGASSYIHNLVPRLAAQNTKYDFVAIHFPGQQVPGTNHMESLICPDRGVAAQILWDQFVLPIRLKQNNIAVYHSLKMLGSFFSPCPQIKVAHSITSPYKGEFPATWQQNVYWIVMGNRLYRRSDRLIAVSHYVKDFLVEALHIPVDKISVIHNAIDSRFKPDGAPGRQVSGTGSVQPYLLTVGNIFPVKNHITAVEAFARIADQFPDLNLVMAGGTHHPYCAQLEKIIVARGLTDRVQLLGFVTADRLVELYRDAELLLMPSLTEGCPVTLLEALSCEVPVIGSRRGGIEEIGDNAIVLIDDPYDIPAWADAIRNLLTDPPAMARLREAAAKRAKCFDWDVCAQQTMAEYEIAMAARPNSGAT